MNMTTLRALLRCASLALAMSSCRAFAPSANSLRCQFSLSASSNNCDEVSRSPQQAAGSRRTFLASAIAAAAAAPLAAVAEDAPSSDSSSSNKIKPLPQYIYNVLRVREATEQETRLLSTGKFKDVQRANVKLAIKFILNNYGLSDSVIAASAYLKGNARVQASGAGQSAVQSLYTIVEYFDSSDVENIKVNSLTGKEAIVNNGLKAVRRDIDEFLSYFPADVIEEQRQKVKTENELNFKEFDPALGSILNPNPV